MDSEAILTLPPKGNVFQTRGPHNFEEDYVEKDPTGRYLRKVEENNSVKKRISTCDVEALKKCLEANNGDYVKCHSHIEAFKSSCSLKKPNPPSLD